MFKVGDKVKVLSHGNTDKQHLVGKVSTVLGYNVYGNVVYEADSVAGVGVAHQYGSFPRRLELVQDAPTSRANDPTTSKCKRKVNKYEQAVLDILRGLYEGQGYTGKQIASLTGHPLNCITPRFAPLRRKGLIKDSGIKRDKQIVWVLA